MPSACGRAKLLRTELCLFVSVWLLPSSKLKLFFRCFFELPMVKFLTKFLTNIFDEFFDEFFWRIFWRIFWQSTKLVMWPTISLKFPPQIWCWIPNQKTRFWIQLSDWSASNKSVEEILSWYITWQLGSPIRIIASFPMIVALKKYKQGNMSLLNGFRGFLKINFISS